MKKQLLLGCGTSRIKKMWMNNDPQWEDLTTLDYNKDHNPDVVWDLCFPQPLPFPDNTFDEIHAYEVLEHIGQQGDYATFFRQFSDYWRILKPGGFLFASVPSRQSAWAWGDPSHTRIIQKESLIFLNQKEYEQVGKTAMSDFRFCYKADFEPAFLDDNNGEFFNFVLAAIKPSRIQ